MTWTAIWMLATVVTAGPAETVKEAGQAIRESVEDATLTARIETMFLLNDHLNPFNINTTTRDGVVTLTGGVSTEVQKDLAQELARSFEGTKDVINNITVMNQPAPLRRKRDWRQRVEDATISASVRTRLLYHKEFKGLRIGVKTENHLVTLSGVVTSEAQKHKMRQIAFDTRGVKEVINNLTVHAKAAADPLQRVSRQMSDEWVEKRVETSILFNRHIGIRAIDVEVEDGLCILTGTVDTQVEKDLAGAVADSIQGVREVRNELRVRPNPAASAPETSQSGSPVDEEYVPLP